MSYGAFFRFYSPIGGWIPVPAAKAAVTPSLLVFPSRPFQDVHRELAPSEN